MGSLSAIKLAKSVEERLRQSAHIASKRSRVESVFFFPALSISTTVPGSFELFPHLPPELQAEIWKLSAPDTRIVEVIMTSRTGKRARRQVSKQQKSALRKKTHDDQKISDIKTHSFSCKTRVTVPALLHVCQGSRAAGQRIYQLLRINGVPQHVCFSFTNDVLYVSSTEGVRGLLKEMVQKPAEFATIRHLQHLAIPLDVFYCFINSIEDEDVLETQFAALKDLSLVARRTCTGDANNLGPDSPRVKVASLEKTGATRVVDGGIFDFLNADVYEARYYALPSVVFRKAKLYEEEYLLVHGGRYSR